MSHSHASRFSRLTLVGVCYVVLTLLEVALFQDWMTFAREVGIGLQAGFAAALIYGGILQSRRQATRYGFSAR
jgi:hypothetical protein